MGFVRLGGPDGQMDATGKAVDVMTIDHADLLRRFPLACAVLVHPVEVVQDYIVDRFEARFEDLDPLVAQAVLDTEMLGWFERDDSPVTPGQTLAQRRNPWGISFMTMFGMSEDADLFATKDAMEDAGFALGADGRFERTEMPPRELMIEIDGEWRPVAPMLEQRGLISIEADVADSGEWTITRVVFAGGATTDPAALKTMTDLVSALNRQLDAAEKMARLVAVREIDDGDKVVRGRVVQRGLFGEAA